MRSHTCQALGILEDHCGVDGKRPSVYSSGPSGEMIQKWTEVEKQVTAWKAALEKSPLTG